MRAPNRRGRVRSAVRLAMLSGWAGLAVLAGCGGGGGASAVSSGLAMRAVWQRGLASRAVTPRGFDGSTEVPPSVQTIEVRVSPAGTPPIRVFVAPTGASVRVNNIAPGVVTVQMFGYDVPFADVDEIEAEALPPSFASGPKSVQIAPYAITNAGVFELMAQPFITEFDPVPGATGVGRLAAVELVIATAVGAIDQDGINIDIDGLAIVRAGVTDPNAGLIPCDDRFGSACSAGGDQDLIGFRFFYDTPAPYAPDAPVGVFVSAGDFQGLTVAYSYGFTTGTDARVAGLGARPEGGAR